MQIHNRKEREIYRKRLRNNMTPAEVILWTHLKGSQSGIKFRRQHSVGRYILDFSCATARVAIELDGQGHFSPEAIEYGKERTAFLNRFNIKVVRFENMRVFNEIEKVLEEIRSALADPGVSPLRRGRIY